MGYEIIKYTKGLMHVVHVQHICILHLIAGSEVSSIGQDGRSPGRHAP